MDFLFNQLVAFIRLQPVNFARVQTGFIFAPGICSDKAG
jgi:hypothetical protein